MLLLKIEVRRAGILKNPVLRNEKGFLKTLSRFFFDEFFSQMLVLLIRNGFSSIARKNVSKNGIKESNMF